MTEQAQMTDRACRFPGCTKAAVPSEAGTGRPPEYCEDPDHTRASAWRARRRLALPEARAVEDRPVDAARQRASEIRGQVGGMIEHLEGQLRSLVDELRTIGDPDAAEAQLESVASDAAEQIAAANARASRAEQAQRKAEAERAEADAAAAEATELSDQLQADVAAARAELAGAQAVGEQLAGEIDEARSRAAAERLEHQTAIAQVRDELGSTQARLEEAEQGREGAVERALSAEAGKAEAEERARSAAGRADAEAARATRAERESTAVRERLEAAREQVADVRGQLASVTATLASARADIDRERAHGDQRVADLRASYDSQLQARQVELDRARDEATGQRSRADPAEAQVARGAGRRGRSSGYRRPAAAGWQDGKDVISVFGCPSASGGPGSRAMWPAAVGTACGEVHLAAM